SGAQRARRLHARRAAGGPAARRPLARRGRSVRGCRDSRESPALGDAGAEGGGLKNLLHLARGVDALSAAAAWLATWCVFAACLVSAGNAIVRYSLDMGSNAWLETQWYLFAVI